MFVCKIYLVMWPRAGVIAFSLEGLQSLDVGNIACRNAANASNQVLGCDPISLVCFDFSAVGIFHESCGGDPGVELDVSPQVKAVGDVVDVGQDFRLFRVLATPVPVLEQFL